MVRPISFDRASAQSPYIDTGTEWFKIRPGNEGVETLATYLNSLLGVFHNENFNAIGGQTPLQVAAAWVQTQGQEMQNHAFN